MDDPLTDAAATSPSLVWQELVAQKHHLYPLYNEEKQRSDWLAYLHHMPEEARGGIQFLVRPAPDHILDSWKNHLNKLSLQLQQRGSKTTSTPDRTSSSQSSFGPARQKELEEEVRMLTGRLQQAHQVVEVGIRVWAAAENQRAAEKELRRLLTHVKGELKGRYNRLVDGKKGQDKETLLGRHFPLWGGVIVTAAELGRLLQLPDEETAVYYPRLQTADSNPLGPEERIIVAVEDTIEYTMHQRNAGQDQPAGYHQPVFTVVPRPKVRTYGTYTDGNGRILHIGHPFAHTTTHLLAIGATGTGKSVAAANIALQDWLAGHSVLVLDPHGSLITDILRGVPQERERDVIILDPADPQPPRYNICRLLPGRDLEVVISYILDAIRTSQPASWDSSVGMQEMLRHALALALDATEERSMVDVAAIFDENGRNKRLKEKKRTLAGDNARHYWQEKYPKFSKDVKERAENAAYRRISPFVESSLVRRMLGMAGCTVDLSKAIEQGKLIVAPMTGDMGVETKRLWGALLVREFILCLQRRGEGSHNQATLMIDEVGDSVGTLGEFIKTIVTQLRKFGASACFFIQQFSQTPEDVAAALRANCRTQICFNNGVDDARVTAQMLGKWVEAEDIQNLRPFHAYVRLALPGGQSRPCLLQMRPPIRADQTATLSAPRPIPPPEFPDGEAPTALTLDLSETDILAYIQKKENRENQADRILQFLSQQLPPVRYEKLCDLKHRLDAWRYEQLLTHPHLLPDKVKRIQSLSRYRYGIPWWQSDVAYKHLLQTTRQQTGEDKFQVSGSKFQVPKPET